MIVLYDQGEGYQQQQPITFLQRKLNESAKSERKQLKTLLRVNCVSYVDPITF